MRSDDAGGDTLGNSIQTFVSYMEGTIDNAAKGHIGPGHVALHRMNRKEYANAVRDLFGVDIDPGETLPRDDARDGFDNVASALQVSPSFMNQYLAAARTVVAQALGNAHAQPVGTTYTSQGSGQNAHPEGLPLGTRGGIVAEHNFPADGDYIINIANMAQAIWVQDMEFENHVVVTLDRRKVYATAGPHQIGVSFLHRSFAESQSRLQSHIPGGGEDRILRVTSFAWAILLGGLLAATQAGGAASGTAPTLASATPPAAAPPTPARPAIAPPASPALVLVLAAERGDHGGYFSEEEAIEEYTLLRAAGADVNARTNFNETPLHSAALHGWNEIIKRLAADGAHLDAEDRHGLTPLDFAMGRIPKDFNAIQAVPRNDTAALLKSLGAHVEHPDIPPFPAASTPRIMPVVPSDATLLPPT